MGERTRENRFAEFLRIRRSPGATISLKDGLLMTSQSQGRGTMIL